MTLRRATPADAAVLVALEAAAFGPDGWSAALVRAELEAPGRHVLVAEDHDAVVGWAVLHDTDPVDVLRLGVAPGARRRGTGRALLEALVDHAAPRPVLLEVEDGNAPALAVYAAAGFVQIARRPGYYGRGRDALVLRRAPDDTQQR